MVDPTVVDPAFITTVVTLYVLFTLTILLAPATAAFLSKAKEGFWVKPKSITVIIVIKIIFPIKKPCLSGRQAAIGAGDTIITVSNSPSIPKY